jgi:hypothetical protein
MQGDLSIDTDIAFLRRRKQAFVILYDQTADIP